MDERNPPFGFHDERIAIGFLAARSNHIAGKVSKVLGENQPNTTARLVIAAVGLVGHDMHHANDLITHLAQTNILSAIRFTSEILPRPLHPNFVENVS